MSCFAAVEVKAGEHDVHSIARFFAHASGIGLKFDFLEPYGPLSIGTTIFVRFKTECPRLDELIPFFQDEARAIIIPGKAGYRMITQTTEGAIPIVSVQAAKLPGYNRRWRGTANKFWTRQFPS
jgi:hypothetical protein